MDGWMDRSNKAVSYSDTITQATHDESPVAIKSTSSSGNVKNPFKGISKEQILSDAAHFAQKFDLVDQTEYFQKGALVAQHPDSYEEIVELNTYDRKILQDEKEHRWRHPKALYFTVFMNSVGAAIQGWDQTGSNGANLSYPQYFGIADKGTACEAEGTCVRNSWIIGAINSAPYMALCLL